MGIVLNISIFIYNTIKLIVVFAIMISALVLINVALLLNALTLLFSRRLFYHFGTHPPQMWCCFCMFCLKKYLNFSFTCRAPDLSQIERAVVIANHQTMLDVAVLYCCAHEFGKGQHPRWLGKHSFKNMPLLGWAARLSGNIMFLHRDWARDRERLNDNFRELTDSPRPFWLCFFPEGTRINPAKLQASQRHAREKHYPVLHKVLLPRPKGFTAAVQGLRAHIDAVLDVSIHYSQPAPFIAALVRGKQVNITVQYNVIKPDTLPNDDADLKQFLLEIYQAKDKSLIQLGRNA